MRNARGESRLARLLRRAGLGLRHPSWAIHFVSNRLRAILMASLMADGNDLGTAIRLGEVVDRMKIMPAIRTGRPVSLDIGDQALIVFPENIRHYIYEDIYAQELFRQALRGGDRV